MRRNKNLVQQGAGSLQRTAVVRTTIPALIEESLAIDVDGLVPAASSRNVPDLNRAERGTTLASDRGSNNKTLILG